MMEKHQTDTEKQEVAHTEQKNATFADQKSLGTTATRTSYAPTDAGVDYRAVNKAAERKLLLKLDVVILPLAILLYLAAYLDRGNMANARLQGLQEDVLRGSDTNYSIALSCFFITYIVFSIPGTLLAKMMDPSISIACGALIWSISACCQAATQNPAGLFACRLGVGLGESMFGQAIALYFTYWYKKDELSKRVGAFICAGSLSGAFGGLISYGVSSIKSSAIPQWRILFLIEGCPSVLLSIVVFFCLPARPHNSKYITEDERVLALTRLNEDSLGEGNTGIDKKALKRAFTDPKTYIVAVAYSAMNCGLGSVGGFLPTIVKGLGYTNAEAQLYTVPPYACALGVMLLLTTISDKYRTRGIPVMCVFAIGIVGWAILMSVSPIEPTKGMLRARYFACHMIVSAGYSAIPLIISWQSDNTGAQTQRAVSLGMLNAVGQCLSIAAAFLFPTAEGPRYTKGAAVNVALQSLGLCITGGMSVWYRIENKKRDKREGGRPEKGVVLNVIQEYDLAPGFRYTP